MMLLIGYNTPNIYRNKLQNILECFINCAITYQKKALCALYYNFVYSRAKNGISTWRNVAKKYLNCVTVRMNDILRAINFSSTYQNINNLYKNFEFLKLQDIYKFDLAKLMYSTFWNKINYPNYLVTTFLK